MPTQSSMLNIMPYSCHYCMQGFKALQHVSEEANAQGIFLTELQGEEAVKDLVWETLSSIDPIFINGFGHGNTNIYTGDTEEAIFTDSECDILAGRIVYLLSCLTAVELGPAIISAGGLAYAGYNIEWTWMTEDINADPYELFLAEGFYRSANEFPTALIRQFTVDEARARSLAEYNRWIEIWETERADSPYAAEAIKWLIHDRDGLTVLGDLEARITTSGVATFIETKAEPPANTHAGENFPFSGRLLEKETENAIAGKEIKIAQLDIIATTDAGGNWSFEVSLPKGEFLLSAIFSGGDGYLPSGTSLYPIEVGGTTMQVLTPPQKKVDVGEKIVFSGILIDKATDQGLPGRTVNLIGDVADSILTANDGSWQFEITIDVAGRYDIGAIFPGDDMFIVSETAYYRVNVGVLLIFGYDGDAPLLRVATRIVGSIFEVEEDGQALDIITYIMFPASSNAKVRCAIYRQSDLRLLGITEEKEFLAKDGAFSGFITFELPGKPRFSSGKYILVGWASGGVFPAAMYFKSTGDSTRGVEQEGLIYNSFPDPLIPTTYSDAVYRIYCEYRKEETGMTVTFKGTVGAQANSGEQVTIMVTLPDGSTEQVVCQTKPDATFMQTYTNIPGAYKAMASIGEDDLYQAAQSAEVPFTIGKEPRTITLTIA
jgi:hypothetical protein